MKKILSYLLFAIGLGIIITSFYYFAPTDSKREVLILNMVITSFIYFLFFIDVLIPMVNFKDKSQAKIGSLGIRWLVTILYTLFAVGLMLFFTFGWEAKSGTQIILHSILAFLTLLGLFSAMVLSSKVENVFHEEQKSLSLLFEIKNIAEKLIDNTQFNSEITPEIKGKLIEFSENIRYISPSNNVEAFSLEKSIKEELNKLENALQLNSGNSDIILASINKCNILYKNRKSIYST